MSDAAVVVEPETVSDPDQVGAALELVFAAVQDAVRAGRSVVVVLDDADLIGQRDPSAAALANGALGIVRAAAIEGARKGWEVNALAVGGEHDADDVRRWSALLSGGGLSGQLLRPTATHLGKVLS